MNMNMIMIMIMIMIIMTIMIMIIMIMIMTTMLFLLLAFTFAGPVPPFRFVHSVKFPLCFVLFWQVPADGLRVRRRAVPPHQ